MEATRAEFSYASALNRNELFACRGLRSDIPSLLAPEEEVLLVLPGVAGDFPEVMIATSTRFLLAAVAGPIRRAKIKREVPASQVTGAEYAGRLFSRLTVTTTSRSIKMLPHRSQDAMRFAQELNALLRGERPTT